MDFTTTLWQGLLANLAAVSLLTMLWVHLIPLISRRSALQQSILLGVVFAMGILVVMQMPFKTPSGFRLDHRFTLIGLSAFFGGPVALAITAGTAAVYRIYIGGPAVITGLTGIAISSTTALGAYLASRGTVQRRAWHVVAFSAAIPVGVFASLFLLPKESWPTSKPEVAIPFVITVFLATLLSSLAIYQEQRRLAATEKARVFEAVINALPDCLNVKDLSGRFVAANPATAALMHAKDANALIGKTDFDFYPQHTAKSFRDDETEVMQTGTAYTVEQEIEREDSTITYLSTLKAPLYDSYGILVGLITLNRDITDKRVLESNLYHVRQTLDDAITNMNDGLAIYDRDGRLTFCNAQYRNLFPMTADLRVPGANLGDILRASLERGERVGSQESNDSWAQERRQSLFTERKNVVHLADDRWLLIKSVPVKDGILMLVSEITQEKHAAAELEASAREYQALFDNSLAGIFRSSIDGKLLRANPALARLHGFTTENELVGAMRDIADEWYVDPSRRAEFRAEIEAYGRVTDFVSEIYRFRTRERIWVSETAWMVTDVAGNLLCFEGTLTDITERKLAEQELEQANSLLYSLSRTDGLTGLANRRAFDDCIGAEFDRARAGGSPLSLLLIDVDHFKRFNDHYGHIKGDEALRFIGQIVSTIPRTYGDKACRYGGEELCIILPDTNEATARALAEKLRSAVFGLNIAHSASDLGVVTVSIGVATTGDGTTSVEQLIDEADKALYASKNNGRNRVTAMAA